MAVPVTKAYHYALEQLGIDHRFVVVPGVGHSGSGMLESVPIQNEIFRDLARSFGFGCDIGPDLGFDEDPEGRSMHPGLDLGDEESPEGRSRSIIPEWSGLDGNSNRRRMIMDNGSMIVDGDANNNVVRSTPVVHQSFTRTIESHKKRRDVGSGMNPQSIESYKKEMLSRKVLTKKGSR